VQTLQLPKLTLRESARKYGARNGQREGRASLPHHVRQLDDQQAIDMEEGPQSRGRV
jgi:hypothetical protein